MRGSLVKPSNLSLLYIKLRYSSLETVIYVNDAPDSGTIQYISVYRIKFIDEAFDLAETYI